MSEKQPAWMWPLGGLLLVAALTAALLQWQSGERRVSSTSGPEGGALREADPTGDDGLGWTIDERTLRAELTISPAGAPVALTPAELFPALRGVRDAVRECVRAKGRELSQELLTLDGGVRTISFELTAAGAARPETFSLEPSLDPETHGCFADAFAGAEYPAPGGDGATVRIPLSR